MVHAPGAHNPFRFNGRPTDSLSRITLAGARAGNTRRSKPSRLDGQADRLARRDTRPGTRTGATSQQAGQGIPQLRSGRARVFSGTGSVGWRTNRSAPRAGQGKPCVAGGLLSNARTKLEQNWNKQMWGGQDPANTPRGSTAGTSQDHPISGAWHAWVNLVDDTPSPTTIPASIWPKPQTTPARPTSPVLELPTRPEDCCAPA